MFDIELFLECVGTIDTAPQFLEDHLEFIEAHSQKFSVNAGKSSYDPFDMIALVVGIGRDGAKEDEFMSYLQFSVMDSSRAKLASNKVKCEVQAYLTRSSSRRTSMWTDAQIDSLSRNLEVQCGARLHHHALRHHPVARALEVVQS